METSSSVTTAVTRHEQCVRVNSPELLWTESNVDFLPSMLYGLRPGLTRIMTANLDEAFHVNLGFI